MSDNLQFYIGYTLVDITSTGVTRSKDADSLERNQQRNWETVLQCIGLRTQPLQIQEPKLYTVSNLESFNFGDFYQSGPHNVWVWAWATERDGVYNLGNKELGGLLQDLEQVPIVTGLTETAKFMLPIFYPHGTIKNIYIERYVV